MKEKINLFKNEGIPLIVLSTLIYVCLPNILCAFVMLITKYFLSEFLVSLINILCVISSTIIFLIGLFKFLGKKDIKCKDILYKGYPIIFSLLVYFLFNILVNTFNLDGYIIFYIIHLIINSLLLTFGLSYTITLVNEKSFIKNNKKIVLLILFGLLVYLVPTLIVSFLGTLKVGNIFLLNTLVNLIYSVLFIILIVLYINFINSNLKDKFIDKIESKIILIVIGVLSIIWLTISVLLTNNNKVKQIDSMISLSLANFDYSLDNMDIMVAKSFYEEASDTYCAYNYVIDENFKTNECEGKLTILFKTLNKEDKINILKESINTKEASTANIEALMYLLKENNESTSSLVRFLINKMDFTRNSILPFDLNENEKEELKEKLEQYKTLLLIRKKIDVYTTWLDQGELNSTVINVATNLASSNKDILALQAMAVDFYMNAPDGISGNASVVDRFVELSKDIVKKQDKEKILTFKNYVITAYQKCNSDSKALSFIEQFEPSISNETLDELLLVSYKENHKHEKAEEIALKMLDNYGDNVKALTYLSIYKLQSDTSKSIEYATRLADTLKTKNETNLDADIALGLYVEYLTGFYEPQDSKFCPYKNYLSSMSEEEKNKIYDNQVLNAYLKGRRLTKSRETSGLEIVNQVLEKYNYLSYLYYFKGMYLVNNNEYQEAVDTLTKAIELGNRNPFIYSELGFAYEGVGDLKKSLEAFEMASQTVKDLGLVLQYNFNNIQNYFNVYINNAKHAMYESEGENHE